MVKKTKPKRLTSFARQMERGIEFAKRNEDFPQRWYPQGEPNWSDKKVRSKAANDVLAFNVFRGDGGERGAGSLSMAFGALGLNPVNPYHWRFLVEFLAIALFGTKPSTGRPTGTGKWNAEKTNKLQTHVLEYFEFHNWGKRPFRVRGALPDKLAIARFIKQHHSGDYQHDEVERIYREVIAFFKPFESELESAARGMMGDK